MNNSQKFESKIVICKIAYVVLAAIIIYFFSILIFKSLLPLIDKKIIMPIYYVLIGLVLIVLIHSLINNNRFSTEEKRIIHDELDHKIDKVYEEFGLYLTENYIVCLGGELNFFKLFVVPIKDIDAIDTHYAHRHYRKNKKKSKPNIFTFILTIIGSILLSTIDYDNDNDRAVFNIICGKKVYCITTSSFLNKAKMAKIDEIADYICDKHKDIDYI